MAMGLSFGSVSLIGGYIAANAGYNALFFLGMILSASAAAVMWGSLKSPTMRPSPSSAG
jgi:hypothetical protein